MDHRRGHREAGIVLIALDGHGDDGDLRVPGIAQALAQQGGVVRRTAHAARLCDGDSGLIRVGAP